MDSSAGNSAPVPCFDAANGHLAVALSRFIPDLPCPVLFYFQLQLAKYNGPQAYAQHIQNNIKCI